MKLISLSDPAKSYGRRASHNEEITFGRTGEILAGKKGKRGVTNKFFKSGWWRLKPQQTLKSLPLNSAELAERWANTKQV